MSERTRNLALMLAALVLVGGGLLARFWTDASPRARALDTLRAAGAELSGHPLPPAALDLPVLDAEGRAHRLRELVDGGELLLVHLWAGWCPPCRQELPQLVDFARLYRDRRVRIVAIDYDASQADADAALRETVGQARPAYVRWWRDPQGQEGDPAKMLRLMLGTEQLPETYVVADGRVLARLIGSQDWLGPRLGAAVQLLAPARSRP